MIRVGIIGLGFMGGVHLRNFQRLEEVDVCAVCSKEISEQATLGNIDTGGTELSLDDISIYTELEHMLEAESLDAVSIALPTYLHKDAAIQCLEAGLHVLCEKPMALTLKDCDAMMAAAKKADRQLMIAHCIRFWPEYVWLKSVVESGQFGAVKAADFSRLTYAPAWSSGAWLSDPAKSGGIALDLHIHDLDFIQHLFGSPQSMRSQCARFDHGEPGHVQTWLTYGPSCAVSATASWMMPESFGFSMTFRVQFEQAAAVFEGGVLKVYPEDGGSFEPALETGDGYQGEIGYFVQLISGGQKKIRITPEQARESVRMALESIKP